MHQQREALIQELFNSEKKYLDTLNLVLNAYLLPIRKGGKSSSFLSLGSKKQVCTEREQRWLFGNFDQIHQDHTDNLKAMEER